jgi:hypothetical protein
MAPELEDVRQRFRDLGIEIQEISANEFAIRAKAAEVGDIVAHFENGEFTVRIGSIFHHHFDENSLAGPAAEQVVEFVSDFISGRSVLTVWSVGSRPIAARVANRQTGRQATISLTAPAQRFWGHLLELFRRNRQTIRSFKWTGEISNSDPDVADLHDETSQLARNAARLSPDELKAVAAELSRRAKAANDR